MSNDLLVQVSAPNSISKWLLSEWLSASKQSIRIDSIQPDTHWNIYIFIYIEKNARVGSLLLFVDILSLYEHRLRQFVHFRMKC